MKRRDVSAIVLAMTLVACDSPPAGPSFTRDIVPLLNRHCVMCHMADGAQGELSLHPQSHLALVGVASSQSDMLLVKPGDVEASYLYHKLRGSHLSVGGEGDSMPYQRDLLDSKDISLLEQWIAQGANNR
jgi:mono/diheme cytochrome c family protein